MSSYRCTIKKDGRTVASESGSAANGSDTVARNAALMKVANKVNLEEENLTLSCDKM